MTDNVAQDMQSLTENAEKKKTKRGAMKRFDTKADHSHHNEGIVLLFKRRTAHHEVVINEEKLSIKRAAELTEAEYEKATQIGSKWAHRQNVLKNLPHANIRYTMSYTDDPDRTFVIVVIAMTHYKAEEWAQNHGLDCQVDPREAIKIGRKKPGFLLAQRTNLEDGQDEAKFTDPIIREKQEFDKLPLKLWDHIHITYEKSLSRNIYKRYPPHNHILDNRRYLNILFEALQSPRAVGGANFALYRALRNSNHPLVDIFALDVLTLDEQTDEYTVYRPELTSEQMWLPQKESFWDDKVQEIRDYYGEYIAFYFAFLRHYMKWSYSLAFLGTIWFTGQMVYGQIELPGSTWGVGLAIAWSTFMSEQWYREEEWLRFKWGMLHYKSTEAPRAGFHGRLDVSPTTGELVEVHESKLKHYFRLLFSMSTVFFCISLVLAIVIGIWALKALIGDNQNLSYGVAFVNAIQIQILNKAYTKLAVILNDFEGHRLEQQYYNHLVIKRIFFFVVNSYNSLFYIAFFKDIDWPWQSGSDSDDSLSEEEQDKATLEALRTQLIILFVTLTIFQNCIEMLIPWMKKCVLDKLLSHKTSRYTARAKSHEANGPNSKAMKMFRDTTKMNVGTPKSDKGDNYVYEPLDVTPEMWADVINQINLPTAASVLDNTAEIVIQYGYVMLFVFVFPLMPVLGLINNFLETRIDFRNLERSRRPIPFAGSGIGVWKKVLSTGSVVSVFTNVILITYKTTLVDDFLGKQSTTDKLIFFFVVCMCCVFLQFAARFMLSDRDKRTKYSVARQAEVEKHLLLAAGISAEEVRGKQLQLNAMWEDEVDSDANDDENFDEKEDNNENDNDMDKLEMPSNDGKVASKSNDNDDNGNDDDDDNASEIGTDSDHHSDRGIDEEDNNAVISDAPDDNNDNNDNNNNGNANDNDEKNKGQNYSYGNAENQNVTVDIDGALGDD